MNVENIKYAIEVMRNATNLYMCSFQSIKDKEAQTIEDLHACGNTACFIGYLCLTDIWKNFFKENFKSSQFDRDGWVYFSNKDDALNWDFETGHLNSEEAMAEFLGVSENIAYSLIYGGGIGANSKDFYPVNFELVKPEHVIEKLELILSGELS